MTRALFRHESWLVALVRQRQAEHRTASVLRTETRFGPEGIGLLAAALTDVLLGQFLALVGLGLVALASLTLIGWSFLALGGLIVVASSWRFGQGFAAAREYRAGASLDVAV